MAISVATVIGVGREATWGVGVTPQVLIPVEPPTFSEPFEQILDQLARGVNVLDHGAYQGSGHAEASLASNVYPEEIGFFLLAMLGAVSSVGTSPTVHTFSLATQPPSLSLQDEGAIYPAGETKRRYQGMLPSSLTFSFTSAEGLLTWSCDLMGSKGSAPLTGAIPADATNAPFRGWHATAAIATIPDTRMISAEITLAREIAIIHAADGLQYPVRGHSGPLEVTLSMVFDANTYTELDRVLAHEDTAITFTFTYGTGATEKTLVFTIPKMNWGEGPVELDRSNIAVQLSVAGRAIYDRDTSKVFEATLTNSRLTYAVA